MSRTTQSTTMYEKVSQKTPKLRLLPLKCTIQRI